MPVETPEAKPAASATNRAQIVEENFLRALDALAREEWPPGDPAPDLDAGVREGRLLTKRRLVELFESQVAARHLDMEARPMRARVEGFYTIGSAGHEGNAALAAALRPT